MMAWQRFLQLALCASTALAFRDTSPLFLVSTSTLPHIDSLPLKQVAESSEFTSAVLQTLQKCPSDAYVLVSQPGVSAHDYAEGKGAQHLRSRLSKKHDHSIRSAYSVPDALNKADLSEIEKHLLENCGATSLQVDAANFNYALAGDQSPHFLKVDFPELPSAGQDRQNKMARQDGFLNTLLDDLSAGTYTVVYVTTPPTEATLAALQLESQSNSHESATWETENGFLDTAHTELKRNMHGTIKKRDRDNYSDVGLFETYNYFGPGIFMAILTILLLLLILYVGISAVSGLQVSYMAFNKEMGPAAQKKQQ